MGKRNAGKRSDFDVIVVGSGIAGLYAAYKASGAGRVCLLTKGKLEDTNTWLAQGGIAAALGADDSPSRHLEDTLAAGAGACDRAAVSLLVEEGPLRVKELIALGTPFDVKNGRLALTREGAHSRDRVLHCGGDATGRLVQKTLQDVLQANHHVVIRENTFVTDLIMTDGTVCGVYTLQGEMICAGAVILATGGLGQVYARTTNPPVATGDGVAMAYRAGADVADMEFVQFHPTVFQGEKESQTFLISEAVRGEGAVLRNNNGERFMGQYHQMGELGPRDVVARAIADQMKKQGGRPVYLDITQRGREYIRERFPTIYEHAARQGLDMAKDWLPVSPAAHYAMGGIVTGLNGETSLPGLYACGEAARSGVHGANRLASNSLLEGLVFAWRAVQAIQQAGRGVPAKIAPKPQESAAIGQINISRTREFIGQRMFEDAGVVRSGEGLKKLYAELERLNVLRGFDRGSWELKNIVTVAALIVDGAIRRKESRGGHFRSDFPAQNGHHIDAGRRNTKERHDRAPIAV